MVLDKHGPFNGLDKVANDKLSEFWYDEEAELGFMEIALIAYGPVLRLNANDRGVAKKS